MPRDITGSAVRNLFTIRRQENAIVGEVDALLKALFNDIVAQLARIDPTGVSAETFRRRRIERLVEEIEALTGKTFTEIVKLVRQQVSQVGSLQADFAEAQLRSAVRGISGVEVATKRVGLNLMKSILDTNPIEGHLLKDWFAGMERSVPFRVRQQIQLGMAQNETIDDMIRRIRGRQSGFRFRSRETGAFVRAGTKRAVRERVFSGGVMATTTREAEAIVRTSVNHISNEAHLRTYQENGDITKMYEYVSVLDSRTTLICISLDGKRFRYDDPNAKRPPQHVRCRSGIVAVIDWAGLGIEPPDEGTRASATGQVKSSATYSDWLKTRPAAEQDEILGPGRAKLFRAGKLDLRDLIRTDNSTVPLEDLRAA